jgi:hypothetical protein
MIIPRYDKKYSIESNGVANRKQNLYLRHKLFVHLFLCMAGNTHCPGTFFDSSLNNRE